jgi:Domain of unknown function (DUF4157)
MKPTQTRRFRRRSTPSRSEGTFFKKESQQEQSFFGESSHDSFFQPAATPVQSIQRKCAHCEEEEKGNRMEDKKEEEKKLHRMPEKKEDPSSVASAKEEDKKLMRVEDKKEEDKIQKKEDKKEEKLMKQEEKKEDDKLQKKETGTTSSSSPGVSNYVSSLSSKGNPLPAQANNFFSSRMGFDFSNVKIHADKQAAESAKNVNAKAYTIGNNVVFNEGQFNMASEEGKRLMAHELAHVMQQDESSLSRKTLDEPAEEEQHSVPTFSSREMQYENTRHFADCNGVSVQGHTDANYGDSYSSPGSSTPGGKCADCTPDECVTNTGTVVSVFTANPQVTLPDVPDGLNECEQTAVQNFINTTLTAHENLHVAAFNTYAGTVKTKYTYKGCASGLDAYTQKIHDDLKAARKAASDKKSADLDKGGKNIFSITCKCPDPLATGDSE